MTMATIGLWVLFLAYASQGLLSDFHARKLCHAGCGLGMMLLDSTRLDARLFVWSVAASSIAMTWNLSPLPPFRFARPRDVGITVYLILVSCWFYAKLPPTILAPLFFADPAGAVVCFYASASRPSIPVTCLTRSAARLSAFSGGEGRHALLRANVQPPLVRSKDDPGNGCGVHLHLRFHHV